MKIMLNKNSIHWQWPMIIYCTLTVILIALNKVTDGATTGLTTTSASLDSDTAQQTTTPEPDASPGCKAPDIRFSVVRPDTTTEQPYAKFETTLGNSNEDGTASDSGYGERINIDLSRRQHGPQMGGYVNPYQHDDDGTGDYMMSSSDHNQREHDDGEDDENLSNDDLDQLHHREQQQQKHDRKHRAGTGRRRRIENDNGQTRGRGSRYKRHTIHPDPEASPATDQWSGGKLAAEGDVYYVHIEDILKSAAPSEQLRFKLHKIKKKSKGLKNEKKMKTMQIDNKNREDQKDIKTKTGTEHKRICKGDGDNYCRKEQTRQRVNDIPSNIDDNITTNVYLRRGRLLGQQMTLKEKEKEIEIKKEKEKEKHWQKDIDRRVNDKEAVVQVLNDGNQTKDMDQNTGSKIKSRQIEKKEEAARHFEPPLERTKEVDDYAQVQSSNTSLDVVERVKRKSGKTTGALSRPKGGGDSSSKTTSRKDKGIFDEDGGYTPIHPDEVESEEEEEEEEEVDIQQQFTEVSEIRFPGEIGPLGDRRLCKIRCVKGKWVGPLCATNEEDENGNVKFQPLYKSCHVQRIPPYLLLSYRNISVNVGWDLPHGHSLQARCKDLGLYKLLGESRVLCSNGLWAPRMPSCVPTTLLTNYSDDSAPSIRYRILNGSGSFEPSGVMAVLPHSTVLLDCMYPRIRGIPEWTWTSWYMQYPTGWTHEDKNLRYRLTIRDIENGDSGTFTCTSPRGLTNSIAIVVATSTCPQLPEPAFPLTLRLEGNKLGQRAMYRCPPGYRVDGIANATCLASGNWSSPAPTCHAVQCPRLTLDDPHLSLIELNPSAWGRAMVKCQWGFKLTGPPNLECEPSGVWSGPVPRCKAIQCPLPVAPLNGRIGGTNINQRRLTVGALITFSCNEGHTLVGEPSIICTESGFWSHPPPFCKSQCPYPGDPPNGLLAPLKFSYDSGDYISVQCRPGYVQYSESGGPPERPKCQPDGNWSGPVPECRSYEDV